MKHTNNTQFPREVQIWQPSEIDDYTASLWWNAFNLYGLSGADAAEYVRLERELDRFQDPIRYAAQHDEYLDLCRDLDALTNRTAMRRAA